MLVCPSVIPTVQYLPLREMTLSVSPMDAWILLIRSSTPSILNLWSHACSGQLPFVGSCTMIGFQTEWHSIDARHDIRHQQCRIRFYANSVPDSVLQCSSHTILLQGMVRLSKQCTHYQYLLPPHTAALPDWFCVSSTLGLLVVLVLGWANQCHPHLQNTYLSNFDSLKNDFPTQSSKVITWVATWSTLDIYICRHYITYQVIYLRNLLYHHPCPFPKSLLHDSD